MVVSGALLSKFSASHALWLPCLAYVGKMAFPDWSSAVMSCEVGTCANLTGSW